ncbi:MarR family winged helix-turn-helix transcriptional regulator [Clostridium grantii]|uniref:Transcriptional regulator, MarR family n=1 Tax=Clostridium grantii DSM 8605 TaxID=1121316 RepID=A0A1M5X2F9_9CLOT|nr:MarR family winged helix-turn-helix transcriptional regulator [Clostridium grantii]SHH93772.1 transcriptional regulator, MarR family [Clostridium grantii DSM 8605]
MKDKYIVFFISRTKKKMIDFIEEKLKEYNMEGLIPSHGNILTALYESEGKLTMKEIARIIGKDKSTVTPLVNKLLSLGYIKKSKDKNDKRVSYIMLTDKGISMETKYRNISMEVYETAYKDFTEDEKETLNRLLKKLSMNFNKQKQ